MSLESLMLSSHLIFCHPLLLLPSIFPSNRVFFGESAVCIRWPKYWSFSISPSVDIQGWLSLGQTLAAPSHGPANPSSRPPALQFVSKHSPNLCLFPSGLKSQDCPQAHISPSTCRVRPTSHQDPRKRKTFNCWVATQ